MNFSFAAIRAEQRAIIDSEFSSMRKKVELRRRRQLQMMQRQKAAREAAGLPPAQRASSAAARRVNFGHVSNSNFDRDSSDEIEEDMTFHTNELSLGNFDKVDNSFEEYKKFVQLKKDHLPPEEGELRVLDKRHVARESESEIVARSNKKVLESQKARDVTFERRKREQNMNRIIGDSRYKRGKQIIVNGNNNEEDEETYGSLYEEDEATERELFLESQLQQCKEELANTEKRLQEVQENRDFYKAKSESIYRRCVQLETKEQAWKVQFKTEGGLRSQLEKFQKDNEKLRMQLKEIKLATSRQQTSTPGSNGMKLETRYYVKLLKRLQSQAAKIELLSKELEVSRAENESLQNLNRVLRNAQQ
eukprot:g2485.t1